MFGRLIQECRSLLEADVFTGGKKKTFFGPGATRYKSSTKDLFKWSHRRKESDSDDDEVSVHSPYKRKR